MQRNFHSKIAVFHAWLTTMSFGVGSFGKRKVPREIWGPQCVSISRWIFFSPLEQDILFCILLGLHYPMRFLPFLDGPEVCRQTENSKLFEPWKNLDWQ